MSQDDKTQTRREFLHGIGGLGGTVAVYQAMLAMGLLVPSDARAATNREFWQAHTAHAAASSKPTIAILGAGIAGLCAAYELKKAGYPFYLIEARSRPGGRNHTVRNGSVIAETDSQQTCQFDADDEIYFNAGPARISQHHRHLLSYCRELKVPLEALVNDNPGAYIHSASAFDGRPVRGREVVAAMRGQIAALLAKAINANALNGDISIGERAYVLAVLRDYGALEGNYSFVGSTRAGIVAGSGGVTAGLALQPLRFEDVLLHPDVPYVPNFTQSYNQMATMMQPVGGMDKIAYAFADQLREHTTLGAQVTAIRRTATGVRIEGRVGNQTGAIEADYAIVTIPPSVLVKIPNDFSAQVRLQLALVQYAAPTKIAFQSPRFWETEDDIYGGISWTDPNILQIWYPSGGFGRSKGILLGSYLFGGEHATNFANLSVAARIEMALAAGEKLHPHYRDHLRRGISVAWAKVPYSMGGWGVSTPSTLLQRPDGPFLFAGDHLTYLQGWQEGAVISSLNALANLASVMQG